jgi:CDP-glucose 4,6-dehydratase
MTDLSFYKDKKVLITGHTGFKGTWLTRILLYAGAQITGYALNPKEYSLFSQSGIKDKIDSVIGDIRHRDDLVKLVQRIKPEIIFHLAAQPLVRLAYRKPAETYEINVMGTVNILEAVRATPSVRSFVNITTDKVYKNKEWYWGYREFENLCGIDPYSNTKSCSELITFSYRSSFFQINNVSAISTARSGNVIGGGDYAEDRIIPDCVRAALGGSGIVLRNPCSTRPYQHVLDCLSGYLVLAEKQWIDKALAGDYNFGPDDESCITTGQLAELFCDIWGGGLFWTVAANGQTFHEANFLKLDCSKSKSVLGWKPRWDIRTAVEKVVEFSKCGSDVERADCLVGQRQDFLYH